MRLDENNLKISSEQFGEPTCQNDRPGNQEKKQANDYINHLLNKHPPTPHMVYAHTDSISHSIKI